MNTPTDPRPSECVDLCKDGRCLQKKLMAKERNVYMNCDCQWKDNQTDCPDAIIKETKPSECRHYDEGKCNYYGFRKRCCMRIVQPPTPCFNFVPKTEKKD